MTTDRRRHAAAGARIVAGSLSAAGALALMAFMADHVAAPAPATVPTAAVVTNAGQPSVVVVQRQVAAATPAPVRAAVTTTRGS